MKPGPQKRAKQFTVCEGERGHIMWRQLVPWREHHDWVWVGLCGCPPESVRSRPVESNRTTADADSPGGGEK